jgi:tRNA(Ile)-lysidine synthase
MTPDPATGVSPAEVTRFTDALLRLGAGAPLLLAVSGGPDSMAMLTLAAAALPGGIAVASVDHRLRPEGADEALAVARHCARIGVPHATLAPAAPIAGASLQARAREARYLLLAEEARRLGATAIATAHHADDAAETFLMRAARGSGLAGLAGVRPRAVIAGVAVVRPLLDWRRAELRAVVRRAGVPFIDDPSNRDDRHDRTRFRRLLEANEWLDPLHLAQSAAFLAEADAEIAAGLDGVWALHAAIDGATVRVDVAGLPRELRRRLLRRAIGTVREAAGITAPPWSEGANVEPLLDALEGGHRATQAGVVASARGTRWRFTAAPPRRAAPVKNTAA